MAEQEGCLSLVVPLSHPVKLVYNVHREATAVIPLQQSRSAGLHRPGPLLSW